MIAVGPMRPAMLTARVSVGLPILSMRATVARAVSAVLAVPVGVTPVEPVPAPVEPAVDPVPLTVQVPIDPVPLGDEPVREPRLARVSCPVCLTVQTLIDPVASSIETLLDAVAAIPDRVVRPGCPRAQAHRGQRRESY
jgi:hypothetical protein